MAYTRGQVRDLVRQRCAIENTTAQVDAELNNHINDAVAYVHDFLIGTLGEHYSISATTVTTVAGTDAYTITPTDFYRSVGVRVPFNERSIPIPRLSITSQVRHVNGQSWGPGSLPRYTLITQADGTNTIAFDPPPDAVHVVTIDYHPKAPVYTSDANVVNVPYSDLVVIEACIRVKVKEDRDPSYFLAERAAIQKRIEDWVGSLDMGEPATTQLPRHLHRGRRDDRLF